ncbi:hypothetical protein [Nocardia sp. NPDC059228]|uniref:hypothetical protein n=1 Tax=Nocardia sp. NPDC059228 TaxID=3346777 RepID=UPI0036B79562
MSSGEGDIAPRRYVVTAVPIGWESFGRPISLTLLLVLLVGDDEDDQVTSGGVEGATPWVNVLATGRPAD